MVTAVDTGGETVFVLRVRLMFVVQVSCVLEEYYKIQPCLLATVQLLSNVSKTGWVMLWWYSSPFLPSLLRFTFHWEQEWPSHLSIIISCSCWRRWLPNQVWADRITDDCSFIDSAFLEKRIFNTLTSTPAVLDYLEDHYNLNSKHTIPIS